MEAFISIESLKIIWEGKTYGAIKKMIQRRKIKDVQWFTKQEALNKGLQWKEGGGGGKNGKRPFINIKDSAIPCEVKAKYFKTHLNIENHDSGCSHAHREIPFSQSGDIPSFRKQGQENGNMPASLASACASSVPEKAQKVALTKMDLLRAWKEYRMQYSRKTEADKEFEALYNSGLLYEKLHSILGKVSVKTLFGWDRKLNGSNDYTKLVSGHCSNAIKRARLSPIELDIFMRFLLGPNKLSIGFSITSAKYKLEKMGSPSKKSDRTFRRYAEEFKKRHYDRWVLMREGQKALKDKVLPFIKRDPSVLDVGDVLVADGHRLNFQIINPFTGKPCRAVLVGYLDWKSYDLAGYEIMVEENIQCIAAALRNSIIRLGKNPKITYQDNGKAFKARFFTSTESLDESGIYGLFSRLGITPMFAMPYNARAKIIERWFKGFSETFERLQPSFIGSSINDKPAYMKRNEKFHIKAHNKYIPTIEETIQRIDTWLEFQRSQECPHVKGKTIGQVFDEGKGPGVDINELDHLMMDTKITKIGRNGIRFLKNDFYDEGLYGLRENVMIKYSLFDLSYIKVYTMDGDFLGNAERVPSVHPAANHLGDAKDVEGVKRGIAQQRRLEKQTVSLAREYFKANGKAPQLDWQAVAENAPRVIEKIEKENISLPGDARQISEEMITDVGGDREHAPEDQQLENNKIFHEAWQRYDYLIQQDKLSVEDRQWLDDYMKSSEYEAVYGALEEKKEAGGNQ